MVAIDRSRVRNSFHRHATEYDTFACVQKRVVARFGEELCGAGLTPARIIDIGAGTGKLLRLLVERFPGAQVTGMDMAYGMTLAARHNLPGEGRGRLVTGDAEAVPFADGSFDLVVSTSTFQWLEQLDTAFGEAYRVLEPGGSFRFALFGERTLHELRSSYRQACRAAGRGEENRTRRFVSASDVEAALAGAGFDGCHAHAELELESYPDVPALLRAIRGIGAGNPAPVSCRGLAERRVMLEMMEIYRRVYAAGDLIPATYEVIYGAGEKGR